MLSELVVLVLNGYCKLCKDSIRRNPEFRERLQQLMVKPYF